MSRRWLEITIPLLAGAAYVATASPHVLGGDCGEFATLAETGGVAHPPGFPLYVLLLRAFHRLPAQTPAHAAALLSAVTATATAFALIRAARLHGASAAAASLAAAIYASTSITWKLATHAEVFSQAALLASLVLVASAPAFPWRGARRGFVLSLVAGLALSTHLAVVFLAPAGLYAFGRALREDERRARVVVSGVAGLALGLLPYAYILYSARTADPLTAWVWGTPVDLPRLFAHFRRAEYGSLQLSASDHPSNPAEQLAHFLRVIVPEFLGLPLVAALGGAVVLVRRLRVRGHSVNEESVRGETLALLATFVTMGVVFVGLFNRPLVGVGPLIVERFYVLPMVPLTVLSALAVDALIPTLLERRFGAALPLLAAAGGLAFAADPVREYTRPTLQYYVDNVLGYVPPGTVILGSGDHVVGGFLYGLRAQRRRTDVDFVAVDLLDTGWYRDETSRKLKIALDPPRGPQRVDRFITRLHEAGRIVMFSGRIDSGLEARFPTYPEGPLVRVLPRGVSPPPPEVVEAENEGLYAAFRIEGAPPQSRDTWNGLVHSQYADTWSALRGAYAARGDDRGAARCHARALEFAPWLADGP